MRNRLFSYLLIQDNERICIEILPRLEFRGYERFLQYSTAVAIFNIFKAISESVTVKEGLLHLL